MSELPIEANICEIPEKGENGQDSGEVGAYYQVRLYAVPRVGELIGLFSFLDQASGDLAEKQYEVVQVVHKVHDVSEKVPQSKGGSHFVSVFVKPASSKFFS